MAAPHLCAPLAALAAAAPAREATRCCGRVRSGAALAGRVAVLAAALRTHLRVADGDVVALCAQSTDALLEAWLAVAAAGAIAAPLNPRWCAVLATTALAPAAAEPAPPPQEHGGGGGGGAARGRTRAAL
jgi:acyl-CoA synthetase (AMP-forming)/AMP-acid ligase II